MMCVCVCVFRCGRCREVTRQPGFSEFAGNMYHLGIKTTLSRKLLHFPLDIKIAQTIAFSARQRSIMVIT
jgi:hypothetical protein